MVVTTSGNSWTAIYYLENTELMESYWDSML